MVSIVVLMNIGALCACAATSDLLFDKRWIEGIIRSCRDAHSKAGFVTDQWQTVAEEEYGLVWDCMNPRLLSPLPALIEGKRQMGCIKVADRSIK